MFKRPSIRYGTSPEPETPYQRAGQAWDERIGSARVQARNWRLAFFGALAQHVSTNKVLFLLGKGAGHTGLYRGDVPGELVAVEGHAGL